MPRDHALLDWLSTRPGSAVPLQQHIGEQLKAAIFEGRLPPGTALPSSRLLAKDLGISRGTVTAVYDRLVGEGLLKVSGRSATFVAGGTWPDTASEPAGMGSAMELQRDAAAEADHDGTPPPYPAFSPGTPAVDLFPAGRWSRLLSARSHQMSRDMSGESVHLGGYFPLRVSLAGHLKTARGVLCEPRQVLITSSARAALAAVCSIVAKAGDRGIVEDPGYFIAGRVMANFGIEPVAIPVDDGGIVVDPALPAARLAYVTPTHQMPLGVRLAQDRVGTLLGWARREDAWIIEDDYDSEFRYVGEPVVALQRSDPNGRVIYIGTFSKTLFPSLRVAYLVVPKSLVNSAERTVFLYGQEPTLHVQAALSDFIAKGFYGTHIRRARSIYRRRQQLLVAALNRHLADTVELKMPPGGMNIVLPLSDDVPAAVVQAEAAKQALHVRALSFYAQGAPAANALHLGFAGVPDRQIEPAAKRLAAVIRSVRR
jgi:GntR family transcriptional regulator/MocR family aminotransferase